MNIVNIYWLVAPGAKYPRSPSMLDSHSVEKLKDLDLMIVCGKDPHGPPLQNITTDFEWSRIEAKTVSTIHEILRGTMRALSAILAGEKRHATSIVGEQFGVC